MRGDIGALFDAPWVVAGLLLVILLPRVAARNRDPFAMARFGRKRLAAGYFLAVVVSLALLPLAELLAVRPWVEATPSRMAVQLIHSDPLYGYLIGGLVAWLVTAYLIAPCTAWLNSRGLANGLLLQLMCFPIAMLAGACLSLAWSKPIEAMPFTLASSLVLVSAAALGFAAGVGLPLKFQLRV
jgi:hypothetical protein